MKIKKIVSVIFLALFFVLTQASAISAADSCNPFSADASTCSSQGGPACTFDPTRPDNQKCYDPNYEPSPAEAEAGGCAASEDCNDDQYCEPSTSVCTTATPIGGSCSTSEAYKCTTGICGLEPGASSSSDKCLCTNDSDCNSGQTCYKEPGASGGKCTTLPGYGETCVGDASNSNCSEGQCLVFNGSKVCRKICTSHSECGSSNYCFAPSSGDKYCAPQLGSGAACTDAAECASGTCEKADDTATAKSCIGDATTGSGSTGTGSGATTSPSTYDLPNFLGVEDPNIVIGRVIKYLMGFVGTIALVTFMYGGILWLIAAGRESYVDKGRDTMIWSAIGLAIVFAAYVMVDFVFKFFE